MDFRVERGANGVYIRPTPKAHGWMILDSVESWSTGATDFHVKISRKKVHYDFHPVGQCRVCKKGIPPGIELLLKLENIRLKHVK